MDYNDEYNDMGYTQTEEAPRQRGRVPQRTSMGEAVTGLEQPARGVSPQQRQRVHQQQNGTNGAGQAPRQQRAPQRAPQRANGQAGNMGQAPRQQAPRQQAPNGVAPQNPNAGRVPNRQPQGQVQGQAQRNRPVQNRQPVNANVNANANAWDNQFEDEPYMEQNVQAPDNGKKPKKVKEPKPPKAPKEPKAPRIEDSYEDEGLMTVKDWLLVYLRMIIPCYNVIFIIFCVMGKKGKQLQTYFLAMLVWFGICFAFTFVMGIIFSILLS